MALADNVSRPRLCDRTYMFQFETDNFGQPQCGIPGQSNIRLVIATFDSVSGACR